MTKELAARRALTAHNMLTAASGREPPCGDDGMPYHPAAWLHWHTNEYVPAYLRWDRAMTDLDTALGQHVSRHPWNFRPLCESIIGSE